MTGVICVAKRDQMTPVAVTAHCCGVEIVSAGLEKSAMLAKVMPHLKVGALVVVVEFFLSFFFFRKGEVGFGVEKRRKDERAPFFLLCALASSAWPSSSSSLLSQSLSLSLSHSHLSLPPQLNLTRNESSSGQQGGSRTRGPWLRGPWRRRSTTFFFLLLAQKQISIDRNETLARPNLSFRLPRRGFSLCRLSRFCSVTRERVSRDRGARVQKWRCRKNSASLFPPKRTRCESENEKSKTRAKNEGKKTRVHFFYTPAPTSLSALAVVVEEAALDIDLFTAAKNPSLCGFGRASGAGASGRGTAGSATLTRGLSSSSAPAPPPLEPKADAGATGTEEEPLALASPPPLLLLLLLLLLPPAPEEVALNLGSLYEGTLAKPPGVAAAALPGLEEAPSASASSAAIPSVKGVAVLFLLLLLSPEEAARARGGAEGAAAAAPATAAAEASGVAGAEEKAKAAFFLFLAGTQQPRHPTRAQRRAAAVSLKGDYFLCIEKEARVRKRGVEKNGAKKKNYLIHLSLSSLSLPPQIFLLTDPQAPPDVGPRHPPQADLPLDRLGAEDGHEDLKDAQRRGDEHRRRDGDRRQEPAGFAQKAEREAHGGQHAREHQRRGRDRARDRGAVGDLPQRRGAVFPVGRKGQPPRAKVVRSPRVPRPERGALPGGEAGEGEAEGGEEGQGDGGDGGLKKRGGVTERVLGQM